MSLVSPLKHLVTTPRAVAAADGKGKYIATPLGFVHPS